MLGSTEPAAYDGQWRRRSYQTVDRERFEHKVALSLEADFKPAHVPLLNGKRWPRWMSVSARTMKMRSDKTAS